MKQKKVDNVNHPPHYTWLKDKCGIEVIDITRHMDFCLGNAIKYILRAGHKQDASLTDNQKEIEDLKKAIWYINDRIKQLGGEVVSNDTLQDAINWFKENGIPLWGINENPKQKEWTSSPKIFANIYIDDAALGTPLKYDEDGALSRPYVEKRS